MNKSIWNELLYSKFGSKTKKLVLFLLILNLALFTFFSSNQTIQQQSPDDINPITGNSFLSKSAKLNAATENNVSMHIDDGQVLMGNETIKVDSVFPGTLHFYVNDVLQVSFLHNNSLNATAPWLYEKIGNGGIGIWTSFIFLDTTAFPEDNNTVTAIVDDGSGNFGIDSHTIVIDNLPLNQETQKPRGLAIIDTPPVQTNASAQMTWIGNMNIEVSSDQNATAWLYVSNYQTSGNSKSNTLIETSGGKALTPNMIELFSFDTLTESNGPYLITAVVQNATDHYGIKVSLIDIVNPALTSTTASTNTMTSSTIATTGSTSTGAGVSGFGIVTAFVTVIMLVVVGKYNRKK